MKLYSYLFTLLFTSVAYAQPNYVSTYLENPNINAFELHRLPWDETRLYQYTENSSSGNLFYTVDELAFNTITPVSPPLCSEILQAPVIVNDGLLFVGSTASGNELIYFDEINSTVFDLNPGLVGSDPFIYALEDRVFIVALNGMYKQLFEFDKTAHTVTQLTNDAISVESACAVWADDVYYRTKFVNTMSGEDEYTLMKASPSGNGYVQTFIQNINLPNSNDRCVDWRSPELIYGRLYLMAVDVSPITYNSNSIGIMAIDPNDQVSTTSLVLPNFEGEFKLVQWGGKLGVYSDFHDQFYTSTDGIIFDAEAVPINGKLVECLVAENDKLYFNCLYNNDTREIFHFDEGFQSKHEGEHLHFLHEENDIVYLTDYIESDSSTIILMYTEIDVVDEVKMHQTFHPPHGNTAVIFNGLFTFLFGTDGSFNDNDIFQLTGSPSAGVNELSVDLRLYPNPIEAGETIYLESNSDGTGKILASDGRLVKELAFAAGVNGINTSSLCSGVYTISFQNHTHRIVVN